MKEVDFIKVSIRATPDRVVILFQKGMAIANQAMDEDKAGNAEPAYRLYESAIEHLMCAVKCRRRHWHSRL